MPGKFLSESARLGFDVAARNFGSATNWQDVIFRTSVSQNQNLSYSKAHDNGNYRATFGYGKQFGVVENSGLERITGRINANHKFLDDKLTVNLQGSISRVNDRSAPVAGTAGFRGDIMGAAFSANPTWPNDPDYDNTGGLINPANLLAYSQGTSNINRYLASLSAEYDFNSELSGKIAVGIDKSDSDNYSVSSANAIAIGGGVTGNGRGGYNNLEVENQLLEATLTYNKSFENSKLEALVGFSYQEFRNSGVNAGAWGFSSRNMDQMGADMQSIVEGIGSEISGHYQQFGYAPNISGVYVNRLFPDGYARIYFYKYK